MRSRSHRLVIAHLACATILLVLSACATPTVTTFEILDQGDIERFTMLKDRLWQIEASLLEVQDTTVVPQASMVQEATVVPEGETVPEASMVQEASLPGPVQGSAVDLALAEIETERSELARRQWYTTQAQVLLSDLKASLELVRHAQTLSPRPLAVPLPARLSGRLLQILGTKEQIAASPVLRSHAALLHADVATVRRSLETLHSEGELSPDGQLRLAFLYAQEGRLRDALVMLDLALSNSSQVLRDAFAAIRIRWIEAYESGARSAMEADFAARSSVSWQQLNTLLASKPWNSLAKLIRESEFADAVPLQPDTPDTILTRVDLASLCLGILLALPTQQRLQRDYVQWRSEAAFRVSNTGSSDRVGGTGSSGTGSTSGSSNSAATAGSSALTPRKGPIPDVSIDSPAWFAVARSVERNLLLLPDGRNFFPDQAVSGAEILQALRLLLGHVPVQK